MVAVDLTFMETQKPYLAMVFVQTVYAGMALLSKAAIHGGMNPFVFVVYRQAIASLVLAPFTYILERKKAPPLSFTVLCKIFLISLFGITLSLNLYYVALHCTSATFAAATTNAIPAITFLIAVLLRMENVHIKHLHGVAKVVGSVFCVCGAFIFALYRGPPVSFMNWYQFIHKQVSTPSLVRCGSKMELVKGSLIMLSANTSWSLWLILQASIVQAYPAKLHLTTLQCFFSCIQSAIVAVIFERNSSAWKLGWNVNLLSVAYCGVVVTGITYWLQVWCIEKKGPVFTAVFTPLALLITAIFSAFLWNESIHWGSVVGAVLVVVGLYSVLWGKNKEEKRGDGVKLREEELRVEAKKEETA